MRYIFARHGEAHHNVERRLSTVAPGPELSPAGRAEAAALADSLAELRPAAVYASTLTRAQQTAEAVAERHGLPVRQHPALGELGVGELEGTPSDEAFQVLDRAWQRWVREGDPDARSAPGGESAREVLARFDGFLAEIRAAHSDDDLVVVVGHGGFLQLCLPYRCDNLPLDHGQVNWLRSATAVHVVDVAAPSGADPAATLRCESWAGTPIAAPERTADA